MTELSLSGTPLVRFRLPDAPANMPFYETAGLVADLDALYACIVLATQPGYEDMPGRRLTRDASTELLAAPDRPQVVRLQYGSEWAVVLAEALPLATGVGALVAGVIKHGVTVVQLRGMMRERAANTEYRRVEADTEKANARLRAAEAQRQELENELLLRRIRALDSQPSDFVRGDEPEPELGFLTAESEGVGLPELPVAPDVLSRREEAVGTRQEAVTPRPRSRSTEPEADVLHLADARQDPFNYVTPYVGPLVAANEASSGLGTSNPGVTRALNARAQSLRDRIRRLGGMAVEAEG